MSKETVDASVSFSCQCGSSNLHLIGAVKTKNDKTYIIAQCEDCNASVPISMENTTIKLFEITPSKGGN